MTRRRIVIAAGACVLVALFAVALLQSAPVRARALAAVIARVEQAGFVLRASDLEYNLASLTVDLRDVSLATTAAVATPLVSAESIRAVFGWGVFLGRVDLKQIDVVRPRVTLVRNASGETNWTIASRSSSSSPVPLHIGRGRIEDLRFSWTDEQSSASASLGLSLELRPGDREIAGPVVPTAPLRIRWGDHETTTTALTGTVAWNDRDVSFTGLSVRLPEGALRVDGRIADVQGDPRIDATLVTDAELARVAPWLPVDGQLAGTTPVDARVAGAMHVEARLGGAVANPTVAITAAVSDLRVEGLPPMAVDTAVNIANTAADVTSFRARVADGTVTAQGRAAFDGPGSLRVSWQRLDLAALLRDALGNAPKVIPASRTNGTLEAKWSAARIQDVQATGRVQLVANHERVEAANTRSADASSPAGGSNAGLAGFAREQTASSPRRGPGAEPRTVQETQRAQRASTIPLPIVVPIDGRVDIDLRESRWRVAADGLDALGVRATADLTGSLNTSELARSSVGGSLHVVAEDVADALRALAPPTERSAEPVVHGRAAADFIVGGTFDAPSLEGVVDGAGQYQPSASRPAATLPPPSVPASPQTAASQLAQPQPAEQLAPPPTTRAPATVPRAAEISRTSPAASVVTPATRRTLPVAVHSRASVTTTEIRFTALDARLAESTLRGDARWSMKGDAIGGRLTASAPVKDLVALSQALPDDAVADGALDVVIDLSGTSARPGTAIAIASSAPIDVAGQHIDRLAVDARTEGPVIDITRLEVDAQRPPELARRERAEPIGVRRPAEAGGLGVDAHRPSDLAHRDSADSIDAGRTTTDSVVLGGHIRQSSDPAQPDRAGRLEARGTVDLTRETYTAHVIARAFPIRPVPPLGDAASIPVRAIVDGTFDGGGSFSQLGGRGRFTVTDARWNAADVGRVVADVTLSGREASLTLEAPDMALQGSGVIGVDANGPMSVRGQWQPQSIAAILARLGIDPPVALDGNAAARVEVTGTRDRLTDLRGRLTLESLDATVAGQRVELVRAGQVEYGGATVRADAIALRTGTSTLTVNGTLGERATEALTAALDGSLRDFAFVRELIQPPASAAASAPPSAATPAPAPSETARPSPEGALHLRLTATGSPTHPTIAASAQIADGAVPLTPTAIVRGIGLNAHYENGTVTLDTLTAAFEGATLDASARVPADAFRDRLPDAVRPFVPPAAGPATLSARILSITPGVAAPFVGPDTLEEIDGTIDAAIQLEADRPDLDRVRGTVTLSRADLSLAGVSFNQQMPTRVTIRDGRAAIDAWTWGRDDNTLSLSGSAQLSDNPALGLVARAALDLRLLDVISPAARTVGRADAEVRVGGTARAPTVDGFVTVSGGEAIVDNPRIVVGDVAGTVTFAGDRLTLHRISATINGGDAELSGVVTHRWLTPIDGEIALQVSSAGLEYEGLRAEADANVAVAFDPRGPVVGGTVTLLRSAFHEPLSLTGGLLRALQASTGSTEPTAGSAAARVRLDVRVVTQEDLLVDNNYAKVGISGDLRLVGTVAQPSVTGRATLAEGGMIFFGPNRYRLVEQGSIDFANPDRIEPDLDLRAVTRLQGTEITLALKGTPATLQSTLTSDDPRLTQSDLVSLLVTGRTATDAAAAGFAPGSEELLGYLSGEFLGTAGRAIGLDVVRVERGTPDVRFDAGLVASETDPAARLTFGKNIGSKTEVVFSQSLQQSGGLTWIVSYAPRSNVSTRVVSLDDGDRIYDFRHDVTIGGGRAPARAAAPPPRVTDIAISGAGTDDADLRSRLKLRRGSRFSFFRWQDDRERLERFYHDRQFLEARVAARRTVAPGDAAHVALAYDVRRGPRTVLVLEGAAFSTSARRRMEDAWTSAVVDDFLTEQAVRIARSELAADGYLLATVTAAVERAADEKRLRVNVTPGVHARRRAVQFVGNEHETADRLRTLSTEGDLAGAIWTEPDRVRDRLVAFYHGNGYLDAAVRIDPIAVEDGTAIRRVRIDERDLVRVRTVHIDGARGVPMQEVNFAVALAAGEPFTETKIEQAHVALDRQYRANGFNRVEILHQVARVPNSAEVDVTIQIDEGPQQRLRDVVTTGLGRTQPALVSRALDLDVGEPVSLAAWSAARKRLYETGAFRSVDIEREVMSPPQPSQNGIAEEPVRATVAVQEWPPLRLRYGVEVQDEQQTAGDAARSFAPVVEGQGGRTFGLGITADAGARNLFGRAISAGVAGRLTRDFRAARVYATAPSFLGRPIVSNLFVEQAREQFGSSGTQAAPAFLVDKTDVTLEQRVRPFAATELAYRYTLERNHTFDQHPDPNDPLPFDVAVTTARLASTIVVDKRDDLVDSTRGWFHSSDVEYSGAALASDVRFAKYLVQQRYFRRAGRVVFASQARVGLATAFDQSLIPSERFFAGGGNSVRGYDDDVLSPRDPFGDVSGGKALVVVNQEARFPLISIVRGVAFFDAGRAFVGVGDIRLRDLSAGAGVGVRIQTPVVLLRIDMGLPLDAAVGPRRARWFFSVGQMF